MGKKIKLNTQNINEKFNNRKKEEVSLIPQSTYYGQGSSYSPSGIPKACRHDTLPSDNPVDLPKE